MGCLRSVHSRLLLALCAPSGRDDPGLLLGIRKHSAVDMAIKRWEALIAREPHMRARRDELIDRLNGLSGKRVENGRLPPVLGAVAMKTGRDLSQCHYNN